MESKEPLINEEEEKISIGGTTVETNEVIQRKPVEEKENFSSIIQRKTTDETETKEEEKTDVKVEDIVIPDFNNEEKVEESSSEEKKEVEVAEEETPIIPEPIVNPEPIEETAEENQEEQNEEPIEHEEVKKENVEETNDDLVVAPVEENHEVVEVEKSKDTNNIVSYIVTGILAVFVLYLLYVTSLGLFYGFKYKDYTPTNNQTETEP